jgi:hypothetical protein
VPFAYCLTCGDQALIDPSGRCPEGHEVGSAGARVAAGIGSATPHPDEPVPWTRVVELHPDTIDGVAPRVARPPSVATVEDAPAEAGIADTEDLFRELHALGDLDDLAAAAPHTAPAASPPPPAATAGPAPAAPPRDPAPVDPAPVPTSSVAPPPAPAVPAPIDLDPVGSDGPPHVVGPADGVPTTPSPAVAGVPAPPSSPEEATDLDDLASLVSAMQELDGRADTAGGPVPAAGTVAEPLGEPVAEPAAEPAPATDMADEFDALFAAEARRHALADVAALDRDAARDDVSAVPAPATAATPARPDAAPIPAPAPAPARLDDLDFTAKTGGRARRRGAPVEDKTRPAAKRGLFRR